MDGDPHAVLEGMLIGSYAIGAHEGYIYVRAEYPLAVKRLRMAIAAAEERGLLGDDALGSGWDFHLKIKEGAGAFVCGEETALIASIEGKRGMPRTRPPFPAASAACGASPPTSTTSRPGPTCPGSSPTARPRTPPSATTRARAPRPSASPARSSTAASPRCPWAPRSATSSSTSAAASRTARSSRPCSSAARPAAACRPRLLDTPVDYESLAATGAIVGSGGMVVADDSTCMVDLAKYFLQFTQNESCGKCVPCRLGTKRMLEILERITAGDGRGGRHRAPREHGRQHQEDEPLRPRPDGAQPGAHHDPLLPRRVRGAHRRPPLPGARLRGAHRLRRRPGRLHRLHAVRQEVPRRRGARARRRRRTSSTRRSASAATPAAPPASSTRSRSSAAPRRSPRRCARSTPDGRQATTALARATTGPAMPLRRRRPARPVLFRPLPPCPRRYPVRIVRWVTNQDVLCSRRRGGGRRSGSPEHYVKRGRVARGRPDVRRLGG